MAWDQPGNTANFVTSGTITTGDQDLSGSSTDTQPDNLLAPKMTLQNTSNTAENYELIEFRESNDRPVGAIVGRNVVHSATVQSGKLQFYTVDGGTLNLALTLAESGALAIGHDVPEGGIHAASNNAAGATLLVDLYSNDSLGSSYTVRKARGTRLVPAAISSGDTIYTQNFQGRATTFNTGAQIEIKATENFTEGVAYGTSFTIKTVRTGETALTDVLTVDGTGSVQLPQGSLTAGGEVVATGDLRSAPTAPNTDAQVVLTPTGTGDSYISYAGDFLQFSNGIVFDNTGDISLTNASPKISLTDSDVGDTFDIRNSGGQLEIYNQTDSIIALRVTGDSVVSITDKINAGSYLNFNNTSGSGIGTERWIGTDGANNMFYNVPTTKNHFFGVNNSQIVTFDESGNVGIGTTDPLAALDCRGEIRSYPAAGDAVIRLGVSGTERGAVKADSAGDLYFEASGSESMRLEAGGNVAIGASDPFSKFDVKTATNRRIGISDNAGGPTLSSHDDAGASTTLRVAGFPLILSGNGAAGAEHARVQSDGGVLLSAVKSGATQGAAGAAANEIWKTSGHATLPDNVLMIGV